MEGDYFDEIIYPELTREEREQELEEYLIARKWAEKVSDGLKSGSKLAQELVGGK